MPKGVYIRTIEAREAYRQGTLRVMSDSIAKDRIQNAASEARQSKEFRSRMGQIMTPIMNSSQMREVNSSAVRQSWQNEEKRQRIIRARNLVIRCEEFREKQRRKSVEYWMTLSPEKRSSRVEEFIRSGLRSLGIFPNHPERMLIEIIEKFKLPFRYVGDGSYFLFGTNPDFICTDDSNRVLEVFGEQWHTKSEDVANDARKLRLLESRGWTRIVIWVEEELYKLNEEEIVRRIECSN